jgi:hypothetical protein
VAIACGVLSLVGAGLVLLLARAEDRAAAAGWPSPAGEPATVTAAA